MNTNPPRRALQFLRWFCHEDYLDEIEGDLTEIYSKQVAQSPRNAKWWFTFRVLNYFRPEFMKSFKSYQPYGLGMYKNYLKTGWRGLAKNKAFSLINISGLALGLVCSMLIALWVQNEYAVDAFHADLDKIYTITSTEYSGHEITYGGYDTPGLLGEELKKVFSEVELGCNISWNEWRTLSVGDRIVKQAGIYASPDFLRIFSYPLILGSRETALSTPQSVALSRKMAIILFGSPELAYDQTVRFDSYKDFKVTAVFEDLGPNVSESFEFIINWDFFVETHKFVKDFGNSGPVTYIKLYDQSSAGELVPKLQHFLKGYDKNYSDQHRLELGLQPYRDKYLYSKFKDGKVSGGRIEYVRLFSLVAVFVLLIACVNFMNLSTARSLKRAKEIGVRKVNGAIKTALIGQFMLEALLVTSLAVAIALVALVALLPQFNLLTGKHIPAPLIDRSFWIGMIALTVVTGLIAGSYPALLLSSFRPIQVLKQNLKSGDSAHLLRKGLVVFQFSLSMIFIVGMVVISQQVSYIQNKNLGYQKYNLLYLPIEGMMATQFGTFKQEALKLEGVREISTLSSRPVELENTTVSVEWEGKTPEQKPVFTQLAVGYDFVKTMQATLVAGRDFSEEFSDSANYLINEQALRVIGYKDPIGMPLTFWGVKGMIIGVVKDFNFNTLHVPIEPLIIRLNPSGVRRSNSRTFGYAVIRTEPGKTAEALSALEELHQKLVPEFVFAHQFADEEVAYSYRDEEVIKQLSWVFASLAIFISCLGLLGLVMFTAEQRTKEVSIRKVLGANGAQIAALLSRDFMILVFISIILSVPVAYYIMNGWLEGYQYKVTLSWPVFAIAAAGSVLIALATISFQTIKAAVSNPVEGLKADG